MLQAGQLVYAADAADNADWRLSLTHAMSQRTLDPASDPTAGKARVHSADPHVLLRLDGLETLQTQRLLQTGEAEPDPYEESTRTGGLLEGYASPLDQTLDLLQRCHRSQLDQLGAAPTAHKALLLYRCAASEMSERHLPISQLFVPQPEASPLSHPKGAVAALAL